MRKETSSDSSQDNKNQGQTEMQRQKKGGIIRGYGRLELHCPSTTIQDF